MECERKAEMTDEERVREMVTHTVANVVETLGQALLETREIMPSNREAIIDFLREAEDHCFVARVIELGDHSDKRLLETENARLREEVATLKRNRLAAFTQKEIADVASVLGDYLQQTDQEKAFLEEWRKAWRGLQMMKPPEEGNDGYVRDCAEGRER